MHAADEFLRNGSPQPFTLFPLSHCRLLCFVIASSVSGRVSLVPTNMSKLSVARVLSSTTRMHTTKVNCNVNFTHAWMVGVPSLQCREEGVLQAFGEDIRCETNEAETVY